MGAEAVREVYPLTGFFFLSLLYSFEVLVAMAWIRYRTDRNMSIFEKKFFFFVFLPSEDYAQFWE